MLVALVAGLPAALGAVLSYLVIRRIRTPSGATIGTLTERTNELAIVNTEMTQDIHTSVRDGSTTTHPKET